MDITTVGQSIVVNIVGTYDEVLSSSTLRSSGVDSEDAVALEEAEVAVYAERIIGLLAVTILSAAVALSVATSTVEQILSKLTVEVEVYIDILVQVALTVEVSERIAAVLCLIGVIVVNPSDELTTSHVVVRVVQHKCIVSSTRITSLVSPRISIVSVVLDILISEEVLTELTDVALTHSFLSPNNCIKRVLGVANLNQILVSIELVALDANLLMVILVNNYILSTVVPVRSTLLDVTEPMLGVEVEVTMETSKLSLLDTDTLSGTVASDFAVEEVESVRIVAERSKPSLVLQALLQVQHEATNIPYMLLTILERINVSVDKCILTAVDTSDAVPVTVFIRTARTIHSSLVQVNANLEADCNLGPTVVVRINELSSHLSVNVGLEVSLSDVSYLVAKTV
jgi:hypothetical protein